METIYEAFTSGKEVRRENGLLIKALGKCDWIDSDEDEPVEIYAIDVNADTTYHTRDGRSYVGKTYDLIVVQPDPRDEVIKAAEAWWDVMIDFLNRHPEATSSKEAIALLTAIENYRKNQ